MCKRETEVALANNEHRADLPRGVGGGRACEDRDRDKDRDRQREADREKGRDRDRDRGRAGGRERDAQEAVG